MLAAAATLARPVRAAVDVIPQPRQAQAGTGTFTLVPGTRLMVEPRSAAAAEAATALTDRLTAGTGYTLSRTDAGPPPAGSILITTRDADPALGDEGYALDVTPDGITIRAPHAAGLFYGVQTLLQLMPPAVYGPGPAKHVDWSVPAVHIVDAPRFKWRGLMLDVSRHFEPKPAVLKLLDEMAVHKLNVFHWHLTDDQGWRIQIKKYPKLTDIGAWRDSAGFGFDPKESTTYGPDGKYGGFYTQDDVREVVAYAAARHITVVPEVEMPGHSKAAMRAYPEYFVKDTPPDPQHVNGDAGIFNGIYDPAHEQTFTFVQDVLGEVMDLFPAPFIHVGGDEVPKGPWEHQADTVAFMQAHGLAGGEQLQAYFMTRIGQFVAARGKRMLGWDEILNGGLPPGASAMIWHPNGAAATAVAAGHDVVMAVHRFAYLDYDQATGTEPHEMGARLNVQKVYGWDPIPEGASPEAATHVLGVQGCLWSEYLPNLSRAEYMIWPREAALAEVGWTPAAGRDWDGFAKRLDTEQQRLDAMGVNYRPTQDADLTNAIHPLPADPKQFVIDPLPGGGGTVRYTLDGTYPTPDSPAYTGPVAVPGGFARVMARFYQPAKVATPVATARFLDGRAVNVLETVPNHWDTRQTAFFVPDYRCVADDDVTVRFTAGPQPLHGITVRSGTDGTPGDPLKMAVLETCRDGHTFQTVATFTGDPSVHAGLDAQPIAAFRIRFTGTQKPLPVIRSVQLQ